VLLAERWFYGNRLTGQIPTTPELGLLTKLMNRLQLEENSFTGAMPTEVCNNIGFFGRLTTKLGADCSDIDFEVRTECDWCGPHRSRFRDTCHLMPQFPYRPAVLLLLHMLQFWGMQP
jgi:hypothetical protein